MCLGGKESKRGVDYQAALVKVTAYLRQNGLLSEKELQVLDTLTDMQRIIYSTDEKRSPQLILNILKSILVPCHPSKAVCKTTKETHLTQNVWCVFP